MNEHSVIKKVFILCAIAMGYFMLGHLGLQLATINKHISPIWPASGFAMGCILFYGYRVVPAIYVGSFLISTFTPGTLQVNFLLGFGNTLEAVASAGLLNFFLRKNYFNHYTEILSVLLTATTASLIAATWGVSSLFIMGKMPHENFLYAWYTWWSGDAVGILMTAPLFLEIKKNKSKLKFRKYLEIIGGTAALLILLYLTFTRDLNQAILWLAGPALIAIGIYTNRLSSSVILIIISLFATILTTMGYGPFQYGNTNRNLIYIQTLIVSYSLSVLFIKQMSSIKSLSIRYVLGMLSGVCVLFALTFFTTFYEKKNTIDDYNSLVNSAFNSIARSIDHYELFLNGSSATFGITREMTAEKWRTYVDSIHIHHYFDSIKALGFIAAIDKKDSKKFEKTHNFKIKTASEEYSSKFNNRYVMTFIEPIKGNEEAVGLDIGSEEKRRTAAEIAKEVHKSHATEPIVLIQDENKRKAFLVFHPAYQEEKKFVGWTYAAIISPVFFGNALDQFSDSLRIKIKGSDELLYNSEKEDKPFKRDTFYLYRTLNIFGNNHHVEIQPTDLFFRRHSDYSVAIPLILNLFLLFIAALIIELTSFSHRAEELVTERTKELNASKMQLIETSKMASLGEMASGMAHEINNPLTIIQGKIQVISVILKELKIEDQMLISEFGKIKITTDRIEKIVKGLKNFSRSANHDPFEIVPLKSIMNETMDLCAERIKAEGISLNIQEVPGVSISCRPSQISQVLINLFNNSIDAVQETVSKWIQVSFKLENDKILITISDSGKGIPEEVSNKMMEPFFTTKEVGKGTGLGLSISKGIITSHGGKFWFDQTAPHTTFMIEFTAFT